MNSEKCFQIVNKRNFHSLSKTRVDGISLGTIEVQNNLSNATMHLSLKQKLYNLMKYKGN